MRDVFNIKQQKKSLVCFGEKKIKNFSLFYSGIIFLCP